MGLSLRRLGGTTRCSGSPLMVTENQADIIVLARSDVEEQCLLPVEFFERCFDAWQVSGPQLLNWQPEKTSPNIA